MLNVSSPEHSGLGGKGASNTPLPLPVSPTVILLFCNQHSNSVGHIQIYRFFNWTCMNLVSSQWVFPAMLVSLGLESLERLKQEFSYKEC